MATSFFDAYIPYCKSIWDILIRLHANEISPTSLTSYEQNFFFIKVEKNSVVDKWLHNENLTFQSYILIPSYFPGSLCSWRESGRMEAGALASRYPFINISKQLNFATGPPWWWNKILEPVEKCRQLPRLVRGYKRSKNENVAVRWTMNEWRKVGETEKIWPRTAWSCLGSLPAARASQQKKKRQRKSFSEISSEEQEEKENKRSGVE